MKKLLTLAISLLVLTCCQTLTQENIKGTYVLVGKANATRNIKQIQFTSSKALIDYGFGEMAFNYKLEDNYVFVENQGVSWKYKRVSIDTLVNDTTPGVEGIFVRKK